MAQIPCNIASSTIFCLEWLCFLQAYFRDYKEKESKIRTCRDRKDQVPSYAKVAKSDFHVYGSYLVQK